MNDVNNSNIALQTFTFEDTTIRAGLDDGEPWFVAQDVARVLGYRDAPNITRQIDPDEKGTHLVSTPGGPQKMTTITEAGLYQIILKREASYVKDPAARAMVSRFQWCVTHEVLPSLRKTGSYSLPASKAPAALSDEELLSRAVLVATNKIQQLEMQNRELSNENKTLKPKAAYADMVGAAENTLTMPQMAKILSSHGFPGGVVKLYRKLREDHIVFRKNGRNLPCQRYVDAGLFTARISPYEAKGHHYNGGDDAGHGEGFALAGRPILPHGHARDREERNPCSGRCSDLAVSLFCGGGAWLSGRRLPHAPRVR